MKEKIVVTQNGILGEETEIRTVVNELSSEQRSFFDKVNIIGDDGIKTLSTRVDELSTTLPIHTAQRICCINHNKGTDCGFVYTMDIPSAWKDMTFSTPDFKFPLSDKDCKIIIGNHPKSRRLVKNSVFTEEYLLINDKGEPLVGPANSPNAVKVRCLCLCFNQDIARTM